MKQTDSSVLYLHGFNSSRMSRKAQQLMQAWRRAGLPQEKLCIPELPNDPRQVMPLLEEWLAGRSGPLVVVGSSLGGYYATWLAERYRCRALLINPAVLPCKRFEQYLGAQRNHYTGESWVLTRAHVDALAHFATPPPEEGDRYWVWLQTGDETLDYHEAEAFYRHCRLDIRQGGDHGYQGFEERIPELLAFAGY